MIDLRHRHRHRGRRRPGRAARSGSEELLDAQLARVERPQPGGQRGGGVRRRPGPGPGGARRRGPRRRRSRGDRCTACPSPSRTPSRPRAWSPPRARRSWPTTCPTVDADAVARLKAAGAIVFAKTNLPLYAGDVQTYNEVYGVTNNPWDLDRHPGGSSGGAAAALATGMTLLELGSDIGGSIRNPSHYCGVFGHKPTWGAVPQRGHIPGPPGMAVAGRPQRGRTRWVGRWPTWSSGSTCWSATDPLGVPGGVLPAVPPASPPEPAGRSSGWRVGLWLDDPARPHRPAPCSDRSKPRRPRWRRPAPPWWTTSGRPPRSRS